jgi:Na+:H+ antiporter, NhaA family
MSEPRWQKRFLLRGKSLGTAIVGPFQRFGSIEASGGIALLVATVAALVLANSSLGSWYQGLFHSEITLGIGHHSFSRSIHFWVNEGLMTIFFFVVALEIKREIIVGELSSFRQAALPAVAALGGMVVPALVYGLFNHGTKAANGWAIPMATDIAFVVGALTLLGPRVPAFLAVFLVSLAIFDDLGAVVVIALFYGGEIQVRFLILAAVLISLLLLANFLGFRRPLPYVILGIALWVCTYLSGIHATVAGVFLALTIPARSESRTSRFVEEAFSTLQRFVPGGERHYTLHLDEGNQEVVQGMEALLGRVEPPLQRIERKLHPWVSFGVMPLFAFTNCGVAVDWRLLTETISNPLSLGIILGLLVGKQVGIFSATWLFVRSGLGALPEGMAWKHVYGGGVLCGIGFTMSLFLADLSFTAADVQQSAKISILVASLLCGIIGLFVLLVSREDLRIKDNGRENVQ